METLPVASFLAGSLLTILMPTLLLIAIVVWYHLEVRHVPEPPRRSSPPGSTTPRSGSPGSTEGQPTGDRPPGESPSSGA